MNKFISQLKIFKWFVLVFLFLISIIVIPIKIHEHKYLEVLLVFFIVLGILLILFGLNYYFASMALEFNANEKYAYLTFNNDKTIKFQHSEVKSIKSGWMRYIFYLSNDKKVYLTKIQDRSKITGLLQVDSKTPDFLIDLYGDKLR